MAADSGNFAISLWTQVEFASLLARKVRMNELNQTDVIAAMRTFENDVEAYTILSPTPADFELAARLLLQQQTGLRAGDALHLGIAHHRQIEIFSLDQGLIKAAQALSIYASDGGISNDFS